MSTTVAELKAVLAVDTRPLEQGLDKGEGRMEQFAGEAEKQGQAAAEGLTRPLKNADPGELKANKRVEEVASTARRKGVEAGENLSKGIEAADPGPLPVEKRLDELPAKAKRKGEEAAKRLAAALKKVDTENLDKVGNALTLGVTAPMVAFGGFAIKAASDLDESMSKVGVVFGDSADSILAWSQTSVKALGLSRQEALEAAGTLGNLFVSMGMAGTQAASMSKDLIQLGTDLGSLNNTKASEAIEAIRSGLVGESEPLRRYGVNLNEAAIKQEALRLGLVKTTKEALEPAAKAQAVYSLVLQQTKTAQGDFARTSGGMAGQLKIAEAQFKETAATIGKEVLPIATDVLTASTDFLRVINDLPDPIKSAGLQMIFWAGTMGPVIKGLTSIVDLAKASAALGLFGKGAKAAVGGAVAKTVEGAAEGAATAAAGGAAAKGAGWLGKAGALAGRAALPVAIVAGGATLAHELGNAVDANQGKEKVSFLDTLAAMNPFRNREKELEAEGQRAREEMEARFAKEGGTPRQRMQAAQREAAAAAGKRALPQDPEELQKAQDARFDAEKAKVASLLAMGSEETDAQREAAAMIPLLTQRQKDLAKRAAELKPQIAENAEAAQEYYRLEKEGAELEEDKAKLRAAAVKEQKANAKKAADAQKKARDDARALRDLQFRALETQAESVLAFAPDDQKAAAELRVKSPLLARREAELAREAGTLGTDAESQKRRAEIQNEQAELLREGARLQAAAVKERGENAKKARQQEDKLFAAELSAQEQELDARLALVEDGHKARAAAALKIPFLEQVRADLIAGLEDLKPGTEEYLKQEEEIWKVETERNQLHMNAQKEAKDGAKKAAEEAKKRAGEWVEVAELETKLLKSRLDNNPFLSSKQKSALLAQSQMEQYRRLMAPVQGESESDRLKRLIEAEGLRGSVMDSLGAGKGGFKRVLGGGLVPTFDVRRAMAASREMDAIAAGAQREAPAYALARQSAAGRPVVMQVVIQPGSPGEMSRQLREQYERLQRTVQEQYYAMPDEE